MDTSKIIKGVVNSGRYTVTAPIVKEDYGIYLQIEGVELPSTYEVDFSNSENSGTSVTMIGNSDGVLIPHQFIDTGKDIFAFLYHVGANYGRTVYKFRIPNKVRPDRTNEEPTPEEQSVIDQAISALNEAVAQTAQDVIDADANAQASAESARASANSAVQASLSESNAERAKGNAQASAESASASATASAQSASQSAQIKADVEDLADDAQGYAQASAQSASASANSATAAQGFAQSASASAQSASGYASSAQTSANTASNKASEASTSASTASAKATESAQSATNASQSAQTAEQAKTDAQTAQGLAESARNTAVQAKNDAESAKADAESARDEAQTIVDGISGALADKADVITDTASGAIASFTDGADDLPLKSLVVNIDPVQDLSQGDPSPENICPISGWTGVNVQHTGKNLLPLNIWDGINYNASVGTVLAPTMSDKSWTQESDRISYTTTSRHTALSLMSPLLPKGTYRLSIHKLSSGSVRYSRYALDKSYTVKFGAYTSSMTNISADMTLEEDGYIAVRLDNGSAASQTVELTIQVEVGDTESPYEPYNGTTIPITFGQIVYGGRLDVPTGKLTVYPYYASYNGETLTGEWISDRDVYAVGTTPTIGAQVVNIGAEGTEYQLEPHEVASLLGANNIFSDTGDTACEYRADTKLYINRLTEPDADMIADSNIVSGQYFIVGNNLFRATANIANGGQITVGTNCTRVSLAQALNEINV